MLFTSREIYTYSCGFVMLPADGAATFCWPSVERAQNAAVIQDNSGDASGKPTLRLLEPDKETELRIVDGNAC
jgi:hypothetical protein